LLFHQDDIEILYGYSLSIFRAYVSFRNELGSIPSEKELPYYNKDMESNNYYSHREAKEQMQERVALLTDAVKSLKRIRQINPKYVAAIRLMGEIYMKEKKFDRAVMYLKEALALSP
jgi:tetratricopeptide (TPR) repeat protein